jgi:hypothetical protein
LAFLPLVRIEEISQILRLLVSMTTEPPQSGNQTTIEPDTCRSAANANCLRW